MSGFKIDDKLKIIASGLDGTVTGVGQFKDSSHTTIVEYVSKDGVVHESWFADREIEKIQ